MMVGSRARIPVYRDSGSVNFNAIFKAKEGTLASIPVNLDRTRKGHGSMGIGVPVVTDGERTVCMDSIAKSSSPSLPPGIEELRSVCPYLPELCWIIRDKVVRGALHGMMLARDQVAARHTLPDAVRSLIQVDLLSIVELDVAVDNACSAMISKLALALQIELGVEIDEALGGDVLYDPSSSSPGPLIGTGIAMDEDRAQDLIDRDDDIILSSDDTRIPPPSLHADFSHTFESRDGSDGHVDIGSDDNQEGTDGNGDDDYTGQVKRLTLTHRTPTHLPKRKRTNIASHSHDDDYDYDDDGIEDLEPAPRTKRPNFSAMPAFRPRRKDSGGSDEVVEQMRVKKPKVGLTPARNALHTFKIGKSTYTHDVNKDPFGRLALDRNNKSPPSTGLRAFRVNKSQRKPTAESVKAKTRKRINSEIESAKSYFFYGLEFLMGYADRMDDKILPEVWREVRAEAKSIQEFIEDAETLIASGDAPTARGKDKAYTLAANINGTTRLDNRYFDQRLEVSGNGEVMFAKEDESDADTGSDNGPNESQNRRRPVTRSSSDVASDTESSG